MNQQEVNQKLAEKVKKGVFKPVERHLVEEVREDRAQDAICQTWAMYTRYAAKGIELPDAVLVHSCRQRAQDCGRCFVPSDTQRARDVYDWRNYQAGKVELLRLDGVAVDDDEELADEGDVQLNLLAGETASPNPETWIHSAHDLGRWLASLTSQDRTLLRLRLLGFTLTEIASQVKSSITTVCKRLRELGLALADLAGVTIRPRTRSKVTE